MRKKDDWDVALEEASKTKVKQVNPEQIEPLKAKQNYNYAMTYRVSRNELIHSC